MDLGPCELWTGRTDKNGYGITDVRRDDGRYTTTTAHRAAWVAEHGPIPAGLEPDHLCRTRGCVRLSHLELVTHLENIRRALPFNPQRAKTHCAKGHEYSPENTRITPDGARACRACARDRYHAKRKVLTDA